VSGEVEKALMARFKIREIASNLVCTTSNLVFFASNLVWAIAPHSFILYICK
jgi:hypothetical protein